MPKRRRGFAVKVRTIIMLLKAFPPAAWVTEPGRLAEEVAFRWAL